MTDALSAAEDALNGTIGEYKTRLATVLERIGSYHPDCARRAATDTYHDAARQVKAAQSWLAGDYDRTWAGQHGSIEAFRAHYAEDSLRGALHHLLWAEHHAGLRDKESARAADPWR
jgi:hypothetical protein